MAMDGRTDQELVTACLGGRLDAYTELVHRYQDSVYGLAVGMTRNPEDAADMAQEAFIKAYDKLDQYKPEYSFRSWVLRICANQTKNLFRKRTRVRRAEERRLMESVVLESSIPPDFGALEEALGKLPAKFNAPLRLRYMEELSYNEISTILGIGVSAAKMRVARAKQQLAELLGP